VDPTSLTVYDLPQKLEILSVAVDQVEDLPFFNSVVKSFTYAFE